MEKMTKLATKTVFTIGLLCMLMAVPALGATINKSVKVEPGTESGGATSVNGSISVGADATVTGGVKTVNGTIRVDEGASIRNASTVNGSLRLADRVRARDLNTVNGSLIISEDVEIDGGVSTVNGKISVGSRSSVAEDLGNVNGQIELTGATVGGDLSTVNGDIELADGAVVKGDILVEKPSGWSWKENSRKPRIVIGPGARVEGKIRLEREVKLYISETAEVGGVEGEMTLEDAERFSGKRP